MSSGSTRRQVLASVGAAATFAATVGASPGPTGTAAAVQPGGRWPTFGFDRANTGYNPDATGPPADAGPAMVFRADDAVRASPAVVDGTVYVGSTDRAVYALDADTGEERWRVETGGAVRASPAVVDGTVYAGSEDGTLYAFDTADGSVEWTVETGGAVRSPPTVAGGRVYVGSWDASVYAVDAGDGTEVWSFETGGRVDTAPALLPGTTGDGPDSLVCVGSWDGRVYAIDAADGTEEWAFETVLGEPIRGGPAAADGRVFVGGGNRGGVYALDGATGDQLWREDIEGSVVTSPAVADGRVYVASRDGASSRIHALATDGTTLWTFENENELEFSAPAVAGGRVYTASRSGTVYALAVDGGEAVWSFEAQTGIQSAPAVAGARLYVGSDGGRVYGIAEGGNVPVGGNRTASDQVTGPPGGGDGDGVDGPAFVVGPALVVGFVALVAGSIYTAYRAGLLDRFERAVDSVDPLFVDEAAAEESDDSTPVWELVVADVVGRAEQTDRTATQNVLVTKYVDSDTLDSPVVAYEIESYRDAPARVGLVEERFEHGDPDGSQPLGDSWRVADDRLVFESVVDPDETLRTLVGRPDCPPDRLEDLLEQPEITVEETVDGAS